MLTYLPLDPEVEARAIRITPKTFEGDIDLKVEIYGEPLGGYEVVRNVYFIMSTVTPFDKYKYCIFTQISTAKFSQLSHFALC